jgi:vanillate/4-hydroxybenzoate decarboxylase subunit D
MWTYPRPAEKTLRVTRQSVSGDCPACGADELAAYPVVSDGGWWTVVKCQRCLVSVSREKGPLLGSYTPLGRPS